MNIAEAKAPLESKREHKGCQGYQKGKMDLAPCLFCTRIYIIFRYEEKHTKSAQREPKTQHIDLEGRQKDRRGNQYVVTNELGRAKNEPGGTKREARTPKGRR